MSKKLFRPGDEYHEKREFKITTALNHGCEIVMGNPYLLLLDFDDCEWEPDLNEKLRWLKQFIRVTKTESWRSYSGEGWHVCIHVSRPLDVSTRIALQAILGSDWKREMLGLRENTLGVNEPFLIKPGIKRVVEMYRDRPMEKPYTEHTVCHCENCENRRKADDE